jgi:uncharacterized membrane protein
MKLQYLGLFGVAFIIIGILLIIIGGLLGMKSGETEARGAFVGFIGPFPIGFGTDKQILYVVLAAGVFLFILTLAWNYLLLK